MQKGVIPASPASVPRNAAHVLLERRQHLSDFSGNKMAAPKTSENSISSIDGKRIESRDGEGDLPYMRMRLSLRLKLSLSHEDSPSPALSELINVGQAAKSGARPYAAKCCVQNRTCKYDSKQPLSEHESASIHLFIHAYIGTCPCNSSHLLLSLLTLMHFCI